MDTREKLRQALLQSYLPREMSGQLCFLCGKWGALLSPHLIEYYHDSKYRQPAGLVPTSEARGRVRGFVPVCVSCAPRCPKCGLPIRTNWVNRTIAQLQRSAPHLAVKPGLGSCRHFHPLLNTRSYFRRLTQLHGRIVPPEQDSPPQGPVDPPPSAKSFVRQRAGSSASPAPNSPLPVPAMKFILILMVVNTLLFTAAKLTGIPLWQVLVAEAIAYAIWIAWKAWFSVAQQLANQASHMGWSAVGTVKDGNGYRDSLLQRDGVVAKISFQKKCVFVVEPQESGPYKDFVEIERWIGAKSEREPAHRKQSIAPGAFESSTKVDYFERVDGLLAAKGLRDEFKLLQGWDHEFGKATARLCEVCEQLQESPIVTAAFIAESMEYHKKSRDVALSYLARLESGFRVKLDHPDWAAELEAEQRKKDELNDSEPNELHDTLDELVGQAFEFVSSNCHNDDKSKSYKDFRLQAEVVAYIATFDAQINAKLDIHPSEWNTFKAGVENRMLALRDDGHQRSGIVSTPNGGQAFASFSSTYWTRLDNLESVIQSGGIQALALRLVCEEGYRPCTAENLAHFIQELSDDARGSLLPKIASLFL